LFDETVGRQLGINLDSLSALNISGEGGLVRDVKLGRVTLLLLDSPDLGISIEEGFAPDVELGHGNLIRLDVLEHFDFGLSHHRRLGHLGCAEP
jgi:hypothetical protein